VTAVVLALLAGAVAAAVEARRRTRSDRGRLALTAAAGFAAAALPLALGMTLALSIVAGLSVPWVGAAVRRIKEARRVDRLGRQIPLVAEHLADALGAGVSLPAALASAAEVAPEPLAGELRQAMGSVALGQRVEDALEDLRTRVVDPAMDVMVSAISIQRISGGDLSRSLRDLSLRLSERERLARELRGATAQARMTGALVASLPLVVGVALEVARPGMVIGLLVGPAIALVVLSLALQGLGVLLIRRIARVDA